MRGRDSVNIAAYCRVSTDKADQLNSLEAQKRFFLEYTGRTGDRLVRLYADEGISGTKVRNRREFLRMMADAERGLFELVVVKDISRFARNTVDLLQNIRRLKALGIETQFLTANMTSMGNSEFVLTIFGALAQEESANTSKRVKFGKRVNAEKGRVPNLVFGYDKMPGDYFNLAVNREEAAAVCRIFSLYVGQGCGTASIARMLNAQGLRTKRGCTWSANAVCRILENELYTGRILNGKQEVADFLTGRRADRDREAWFVTERPDLKIVDREVFDEAQRVLRARGQAMRMNRERPSSRHLFSTLIKCASCGWSFRRTVRSYKNTYVRWVCSARNGKGAESCPNAAAVEESALICALEEYFADQLQGRGRVAPLVVRELARGLCAGEADPARLRALEARISRLRRARRKYADLYAEDLISREELEEKLSDLRGEAEAAEAERDRLSQQGLSGARLEEILGAVFQEERDVVDVARMTNAQLKRVVERIEVDKEGNVDVFMRVLAGPGREKTVPF